MEQELYKIRSASACIKAAYSLFGSNLKTIFRRLWIPALVFAFIMAADVFATSYGAHALLEHPKSALALGILQNALMVLAVIVLVWILASLFTMLNKFTLRRNILQNAKLAILQLAMDLVMVIILAIPIVLAVIYHVRSIQAAQSADPLHAATLPQAQTAQTLLSPTVLGAIGIVLILGVIFELVLLPIYYFYMKYMMEPIHMRTHLWKSFKTGFRHWGFLFLTFFMMGLLILCLCLVLFMPLGILHTAQSQSLAGILMGDPSGLPSHIYLLQFITSVVTFFIFTFLIVWSVLVIYYAYGSIEQKETERKAITQQSSTDTSNLP